MPNKPSFSSNKVSSQEVGFVSRVNNFLFTLDGLPTIKINDLIENEDGLRGWITNLHKDSVEALLLDEGDIKPGDLFKRSPQPLMIGVGEHLLGRAINPLALPIDGKGLVSSPKENYFELDKQARPISKRQFISQQLETGILLVDSLVPIAKGQRELVIGDARSGKSSFLVNLVINQRNSQVICIYTSIGKPNSEVRDLIDVLKANNCLDYSIIIAATSSDPPSQIFLAPQAAFTVAEYFQRKGKDVVVILDDLGNHAKIYREISLLGNKVPGREAYPGDIFYQHAHILERAGCFNEEEGLGSITALPVIEINLNDFTTYIPTNLMAATDGHLLFKSELSSKGQRPAIDISLSVSRVGLQSQMIAQKIISSRVKSLLSEAKSLETLSNFSGELPEQTKLINYQSLIVHELLKQNSVGFISLISQIILLSLAFNPFFYKKDLDFVSRNRSKIIDIIEKDPALNKLSKTIKTIQTESDLWKFVEKFVPTLEQLCK